MGLSIFTPYREAENGLACKLLDAFRLTRPLLAEWSARGRSPGPSPAQQANPPQHSCQTKKLPDTFDFLGRIAAVTARMEDGSPRVVAGACPNLLWEAELYRYQTEPAACQTEDPEDEDNHAVAHPGCACRHHLAHLPRHLPKWSTL